MEHMVRFTGVVHADGLLSRLRSLVAVATCVVFSSFAHAGVVDFNIDDLSEISRGPGGYVTILSPDVGVSQSWGVGKPGSWSESTRDVSLPSGYPLPGYWEHYTFLINATPGWPYELGLGIRVHTDLNGATFLNIERFPSSGMLSVGAEGGTIVVNPDGSYASGYDIDVVLELSWLEFSNGQRISFAQYGELDIASVFHVPHYMEIAGGYLQSAHIVYNVVSVPEPETYAMLLAGLGVVGAIVRRRRIAVA